VSDKESKSPEENNPAGGHEIKLDLMRIYVRDLSFEAPGSPDVFQLKWEPEVKIALNTKAKQNKEGVYEVSLSCTATIEIQSKTAYIVEVEQAGLFRIEGAGQEQIGPLLGSYCPTVLFPYLREAMSTTVERGGFPQFLLTPVNFDVLYAQAIKDGATGENIVTH
jgi:preprotein translocase subunit SecB